MTIAKLVCISGRSVDTTSFQEPRRTSGPIDLPALDLGEYALSLTSGSDSTVELRSMAIVSARRFCRGMSARMPIGEVRGMPPIWNLIVPILAEVVPIARSLDDLDTAGRGLMTVVRLVLEGEEIGAGLQIGDCIVSFHGDGRRKSVVMTMLAEGTQVTSKFRVDATGTHSVAD